MEPTGVRLGALVMPEHSGPQGTDLWRRLEAAGFAHAWLFDHLSWRTLRDGPWFDTMTTLAAAAVVTERIGLGTLVCTPNFRHPVLLAKAVVAVDHLSGGRLVLGVGSGAPGPDSEVLGGDGGLSPADRGIRFEEYVRLTDRLLRDPVTDHDGRFYAARDARMIPGCVQQPRVPFAIAARGPRGLRLAVEHAQTWVTNGTRADGAQPDAEVFASLAAQLADVRAACERGGRAYGTLRRLVYVSRSVPDAAASAERLADVVGRCADLGFTDVVVAYPRPDGLFAGDPGPLEQLASQPARPAEPSREGR